MSAYLQNMNSGIPPVIAAIVNRVNGLEKEIELLKSTKENTAEPAAAATVPPSKELTEAKSQLAALHEAIAQLRADMVALETRINGFQTTSPPEEILTRGGAVDLPPHVAVEDDGVTLKFTSAPSSTAATTAVKKRRSGTRKPSAAATATAHAEA